MNEQHLREVLSDLDIEVVHKNGRGWLIASCPFAPYRHEFGTDRDPSFFVKVNTTGFSGYNCMSCHAKGNIHKLVTSLARYREADYDKLVIRVARKEIPDRFEQWDIARALRFDDMDPLDCELYFRMYPDAWDGKEARAYLKARGVTKLASETLELRFDPDSKRIMFPVYSADRSLYGFTSRTILIPGKRRPKVKDYAGLKKERCLLGENLIEDGKPILLVEGLFALAHMVSIGAREVCNPVASMGSSLSRYQTDIIADFALTTYLLYDLDAAGDIGLFGEFNKRTGKFEGGGAFDKLRKHVPTMVCKYPKGVDDPDKFTLEDLVWAMNNATSNLADLI